MGIWTKDVCLDSEGIHNPTKMKCFCGKLTLLLYLQEFLIESIFFPTGEAVLCHFGHETMRGALEISFSVRSVITVF